MGEWVSEWVDDGVSEWVSERWIKDKRGGVQRKIDEEFEGDNVCDRQTSGTIDWLIDLCLVCAQLSSERDERRREEEKQGIGLGVKCIHWLMWFAFLHLHLHHRWVNWSSQHTHTLELLQLCSAFVQYVRYSTYGVYVRTVCAKPLYRNTIPYCPIILCVMWVMW